MVKAPPVETFVAGFHDAVLSSRMEYRPLGRTGMNVSRLSLGTSALGGVYGETNEEECWQLVKYCLKAGINYLDTAPWYGNSEEVVGKALKEKKIPREAYYIATKVGRYQGGIQKRFDFSAKRTTQSIDDSLERLGVDYIDVVQVHDMEFAPSLDVIINETLPALQKAKDNGKVKFIGITGYPLENFREVLERSSVTVDTILSYCHHSLNDSTLADYLPYFKSKGVGLINASPNSMGLLTNNGPPSWHPAPQKVKKACVEATKYAQDNSVNIAKLALHFSCNHDDIQTTLVSASKMEYMVMNLEVIAAGLTKHEQHVSKEIRERYFSDSVPKGWGGVEVDKYRKSLEKSNKTPSPA